MAMLARARLTKSLLMTQRAGTYLVVTCGGSPGPHVPRFDERLGPLDARLAQWERVKASGADGAICRVREAEDFASRTIATAKLTKGFLMAQPEGVYLASNAWVPVNLGPRVYTYEGHVVPPEAREAQWEQIKAAGGRAEPATFTKVLRTTWTGWPLFHRGGSLKCSQSSTAN